MGCQNFIMPFGKYKGKDLLFITEENPRYLIWLSTECELKGPLKDAVLQMVETSYFKDALNEVVKNEELYIDACMSDRDFR
jgi:uncharacterized protein (DUF3820 family)